VLSLGRGRTFLSAAAAAPNMLLLLLLFIQLASVCLPRLFFVLFCLNVYVCLSVFVSLESREERSFQAVVVVVAAAAALISFCLG